jgi:hypothetical protein
MVSDVLSTALIKLKIQGKKADIQEFQKRLENAFPELDCQKLEETQMYQNNKGYGIFWRKYVRLGMIKRDGHEKKKIQNRY